MQGQIERSSGVEEVYYQAMVFGPAQSQGSKRIVRNKKTGKTLILDDSEKSRPWREQLVEVMLRDRPRYPIDEAVEMKLMIWTRRPQKHYKKGVLRADAPVFAKSGKDQDKVQRAVGDAAQIAGWVVNDSRIAHWDAWRVYVEQGEPERTVITMRELTMEDCKRVGIPVPERIVDKPLLLGI